MHLAIFYGLLITASLTAPLYQARNSKLKNNEVEFTYKDNSKKTLSLK